MKPGGSAQNKSRSPKMTYSVSVQFDPVFSLTLYINNVSNPAHSVLTKHLSSWCSFNTSGPFVLPSLCVVLSACNILYSCVYLYVYLCRQNRPPYIYINIYCIFNLCSSYYFNQVQLRPSFHSAFLYVDLNSQEVFCSLPHPSKKKDIFTHVYRCESV